MEQNGTEADPAGLAAAAAHEWPRCLCVWPLLMKFHLRKESCISCGRGAVRSRRKNRCRSAEEAEVEQQLGKRHAREVGAAEKELQRRYRREGTAEKVQKKQSRRRDAAKKAQQRRHSRRSTADKA